MTPPVGKDAALIERLQKTANDAMADDDLASIEPGDLLKAADRLSVMEEALRTADPAICREVASRLRTCGAHHIPLDNGQAIWASSLLERIAALAKPEQQEDV